MIKAIVAGVILAVILSQAGVGWTTILRDRYNIKPRRWVAALIAAALCLLTVAGVWLTESGGDIAFAVYYPLLGTMLLVAMPAAWFSLKTKDDPNNTNSDGKPPTT